MGMGSRIESRPEMRRATLSLTAKKVRLFFFCLFINLSLSSLSCLSMAVTFLVTYLHSHFRHIACMAVTDISISTTLGQHGERGPDQCLFQL